MNLSLKCTPTLVSLEVFPSHPTQSVSSHPTPPTYFQPCSIYSYSNHTLTVSEVQPSPPMLTQLAPQPAMGVTRCLSQITMVESTL